eukprot:TRINITY_DN628_c0_g1_i3.p1 TRINITY_DN628_c0_g1~~TRINITY_DN628_c0_g1_i3.p1  ORF type:complete len:855 (-),score=165.87 TRINITY_DN628_c0_g1_i3:234-2798(-)
MCIRDRDNDDALVCTCNEGFKGKWCQLNDKSAKEAQAALENTASKLENANISSESVGPILNTLETISGENSVVSKKTMESMVNILENIADSGVKPSVEQLGSLVGVVGNMIPEKKESGAPATSSKEAGAMAAKAMNHVKDILLMIAANALEKVTIANEKAVAMLQSLDADEAKKSPQKQNKFELPDPPKKNKGVKKGLKRLLQEGTTTTANITANETEDHQASMTLTNAVIIGMQPEADRGLTFIQFNDNPYATIDDRVLYQVVTKLASVSISASVDPPGERTGLVEPVTVYLPLTMDTRANKALMDSQPEFACIRWNSSNQTWTEDSSNLVSQNESFVVCNYTATGDFAARLSSLNPVVAVSMSEDDKTGAARFFSRLDKNFGFWWSIGFAVLSLLATSVLSLLKSKKENYAQRGTSLWTIHPFISLAKTNSVSSPRTLRFLLLTFTILCQWSTELLLLHADETKRNVGYLGILLFAYAGVMASSLAHYLVGANIYLFIKRESVRKSMSKTVASVYAAELIIMVLDLLLLLAISVISNQVNDFRIHYEWIGTMITGFAFDFALLDTLMVVLCRKSQALKAFVEYRGFYSEKPDDFGEPVMGPTAEDLKKQTHATQQLVVKTETVTERVLNVNVITVHEDRRVAPSDEAMLPVVNETKPPAEKMGLAKESDIGVEIDEDEEEKRDQVRDLEITENHPAKIIQVKEPPEDQMKPAPGRPAYDRRVTPNDGEDNDDFADLPKDGTPSIVIRHVTNVTPARRASRDQDFASNWKLEQLYIRYTNNNNMLPESNEFGKEQFMRPFTFYNALFYGYIMFQTSPSSRYIILIYEESLQQVLFMSKHTFIFACSHSLCIGY